MQVRVKNRFDPNYDSELSAGYRSLAINLCVITDETKALGVETHVCEVQLLLIQMAAVKVRQQPALHHPLFSAGGFIVYAAGSSMYLCQQYGKV